MAFKPLFSLVAHVVGQSSEQALVPEIVSSILTMDPCEKEEVMSLTSE